MKICTIKALAIALLAAAAAPLTAYAKVGDRFESDGIFYEVLSEQDPTSPGAPSTPGATRT